MWSVKIKVKKSYKNWIGEGLGLHLGGVWGGIWSLLGPPGEFWSLFFPCLHLEWSSKVLLEASGLDFGAILRGLGEILGGFWEGLGRIFERFG